VLYQLFEWQRAAASAPRLGAELTRRWVEQLPPELADLPSSRLALATSELTERLTRQWDEPPRFGLSTTTIEGEQVAVRERTAWQNTFCKLTHFERAVERRDPRVLIVAPLSGHFATLLRGTVEALLPEHDVYITEWQNARDVPASEGDFDLDDYIDYMVELLQFLGPEVHVLGVCQPVVPVLAAVALMAAGDDPKQPLSMTLMAGPVDGRSNPTVVNRFATSHPVHWFEQYAVARVPASYAGAGRTVYPGKSQLAAYVSMNPQRHFDAHSEFFWSVVAGDDVAAQRHRAFYNEYLSVMDLPGPYFLQSVDLVFQRFALATGELEHRGQRVEPAAISRVALMTIEGERDDISGVGQTQAAHDLCVNVPDSLRRHHLQSDVGHYGVFSGHHWREETMPLYRQFVRDAAAAAHG
jgi:poly(3-hydroxybutyrate) depolymerase